MRYTCSTTAPPSAEELHGLFLQADWARERTPGEIATLIANTRVFAVVRLDGALIGYGRALSDGVSRALLDDIIVDQDHRGKGAGKLIMTALMDQLAGIEEIFLNTGSHLEAFYCNYGFRKFPGLTMVSKRAERVQPPREHDPATGR
ncbi:GNAT family N-acetyltransferase [bacterium]|nr:GNAT family N-acetyltransferase [bacterium]